MTNQKKVRTTLTEDFEQLGVPMDMGDSARMVGISMLGKEQSESKKVDDEEDDEEEKDKKKDYKSSKVSKKEDEELSSEQVDEDENDPIDGDYASMELFDRIRALPFDLMAEEDFDELLRELGEKKVKDDDIGLQAEAVEVVKMVKEAAAQRIRRFKQGSVARKMSFQCPPGKRAETGGSGGRPRCVPSFRAAGGVGNLNKESRRKKRWGRSGSGKMSKVRSSRYDRRRAGVRGEGLMSPLAQELMAVSESTQEQRQVGVREEIIERVVSILEFLNEEFSDNAVTDIYTEAVDSLVDTYEAGRLDEEVVDEDEFISEMDRSLTLITKSLAKLEDEEDDVDEGISSREQSVAKKMKKKGYTHVILFSEKDDLEPLYVKSLSQATELMRTDFKDKSGYTIKKIEDFLDGGLGNE